MNAQWKMRARIAVVGFAILTLTESGFGSIAIARAVDEPIRRSWRVKGVERDALVYVPERAKTRSSPVVFVFHGHGGTARNAARTFAIHKLWPEAIVVYPQGLNTPGRLTDPEGKRAGWQHAAGDQGDRDLAFFDEALATLKTEAKVDAGRIHATGHSNGGGFTYLLWAERGTLLASVAPSGAVAARQRSKLKPKPVLHIAGENDELVKFAWQNATIETLKTINKTETKGKPVGKGVVEYAAGPGGTPVATLIYPGTHKFPAEAPAEIVKFFQRWKLD